VGAERVAVAEGAPMRSRRPRAQRRPAQAALLLLGCRTLRGYQHNAPKNDSVLVSHLMNG
jgi:hypothetical protein